MKFSNTVSKLIAMSAGLMVSVAIAADLPQYADDQHLGVSGCAGGQCHGRVTPSDTRNVRLDEHTIWREMDRHAKAYDTLLNDKSKRIARVLGIGPAHEADMCLDCHADNVAEEHRGPRFRLEEGVGCEACHGGGGRYRDSHTDASSSHADNVAKGMYPTENRHARSELCLSCHLGTNKKFTTHKIMGAGHPRLRFEMERWEIAQPFHYDLDDDYVERKLEPDVFRNWSVNLAVSAGNTLELITGRHFARAAVIPDVALFDCQACHHPVTKRQWEPHAATRDLGPGEVRLNDSVFLLLAAAADVMSPQDGRLLRTQLREMHDGVLESRGAVVSAARAMQKTVGRIQQTMDEASPSDQQLMAMLKSITAGAQRGAYHDRVSAEQAAYAVDVLMFVLGKDLDQADEIKAVMDAAGARPRSDAEAGKGFDPDALRYDDRRFRRAMGALSSAAGL